MLVGILFDIFGGNLLTNTFCWAKFERANLGGYQIAALSWMFRDAKMAWNYLLVASVTLLLERHGIIEGVLVLDESRGSVPPPSGRSDYVKLSPKDVWINPAHPDETDENMTVNFPTLPTAQKNRFVVLFFNRPISICLTSSDSDLKARAAGCFLR